MPTYDWECPSCHWGEEAYVNFFRDTRSCRDCNVEMEKVWGYSTTHTSGGFPYTTRNLDPSGRPIEVSGPGHEAQLCKQFGVRKRDDAGWVDKEYMGWDFKNKKQNYREGNGAGLPGCWV